MGSESKYADIKLEIHDRIGVIKVCHLYGELYSQESDTDLFGSSIAQRL